MSVDGIDSVVGRRGLFMCRIASLFLYQRLKVSKSGNAHDFNNMETRAVIQFFFLQGKVLKEIHAILIETLEHASLYATVKNRVAQFKHGDFSTCDAPRPGWPKTVTTPEITDQIHELILEEWRILAKTIAEQLGISREGVGSIIHEGLDTEKLSAKWVPKCLNVDQKCQRCQLSEQLLEFFWHNPKNSECKNLLEKFSPQFFGINGILSLIIIQRAKLSMRSITHLCWCNWRTFWRKNVPGSSPRDLVLAWQCPGPLGTWNPEETGLPGLPLSWSPTLFSGSGPTGVPSVPWTEIFFEWLAKVRATG